MPQSDARQLADIYQDTTARITALLTRSDSAVWECPVPACPGWSVRDVVSHMVAVAEDWASGQLTGPPTDDETAEHVRRFASHDGTELLGALAGAAARLHQLAQSSGLEPPLGDIACHEHDIRSAIGKPGARDAQSVLWTSDRLLANLRPPVPLRVFVEDGEYRSGPPDGTEIQLHTTRFESLRWRTGRRSRTQLAAMGWSSDPTSILDQLYLFGPAASDVIE